MKQENEKTRYMNLYPDGSMHDGDILKGTTEIEADIEKEKNTIKKGSYSSLDKYK